VTIAAGLFWISLLFTITTLNAFTRNITAALGDAGKGSWIYNAFNLVTVVLAPISSYFSDIYGRVGYLLHNFTNLLSY
jgi:MFS family permease